MRRRTITALIISLSLTLGPSASWRAEGAGKGGDREVAASSAAREKKGGNGFARAIKAPFKAIVRLFGGGGGDDNKIRRMTEKDAQKFESVGVARVDDSRSGQPGPPAAEEQSSAAEAARAEEQSRRARGMTEEGRRMLDNNQVSAAIAILSSAAWHDPSNAAAHRLLAVGYSRKGLRQLARDSFARALALSPRDAQTLNDYAFFLYLGGDYKGAVKHFKRSLKIAPSDTRAWNNLALAQCRLEKYNDAFKSFVRAGGEFRAHMNIASVLERAGHNDRAVEHFEAARLLDPSSKDVLQHLANIYHRMGRQEEAEAARRALASPAKAAVAAAGN